MNLLVVKKIAIAFASLLLFTNAFGQEIKVKEIALAPPLNSPLAQISTLEWCQDHLVLLPQKPGFENLKPNDDGTNTQLVSDAPHYLYVIKKSAIEKYLKTENPKPLTAKRVVLDDFELQSKLAGFDGYESLSCTENSLWFSVETIHTLQEYQTTIFSAKADLNAEQAKVQINPTPIAVLNSQSNSPNHSHETSLIIDNHLINIHEINSPSIVKAPQAKSTNLSTGAVTELEFPNIPFRITDASAVDSENKFWVSNYHYPGAALFFADDLMNFKRTGKTHSTHQQVERLVELQLKDNKIIQTETKPIYLYLCTDKGRNWEGLVRLNHQGFLLITDQHPSTILGFVPYSN